uniref:Gamma-aminobutyric acid type B receptor subunit 2 n=1 Tax=Saccoglossus kowalevskii TaxID=10224 RepID=A0ABM0M1T2_SACKO|nr:PREDICTED: gamma-aminobutyric acid type B receptor subunit 2 [Saccoglossus kowalevskii]
MNIVCGGSNDTLTNSTSEVDVHLAALLPYSTEGDIVSGVIPAIYLALEHVNKHDDVLPGFRLNIEFFDTKCDMAEGTKAFFDAMARSPPKLMVFGGICSNVTAPLAEAVMWWNLIQLSYANTEPFLSEREKYPTFFRTVPSEADFNPAKLKLLEYYNWTRVATIHQDTPRFSIAHNKMSSILENSGKILIKVASLTNDPDIAVRSVKESGARIILGYFDENMARKVFCSAWKNELVGHKYVWILPGWYSDNWWNSTEANCDCSTDELYEAIQGYIATDVLPLTTSKDETISGLTASAYEQEYNEMSGDNYTVLHGYAYDGVWTIALALDAVIRQLGSNVTSIVNYTYANEDVFQMIMEAMNETDFVGVTGRVRFNEGDRLGTIVYEQFVDSSHVKIGEYHAYSDSYFLNNDKIHWADGSPPLDQPVVIRVQRGVSSILYVIMCCLTYIGIMIALMFLFFNMRFRKHRFIKMSSPYLNNLIILGGILCYCFIYFLGLDGTQLAGVHAICSIRAWMLTIGFTGAFGAMFSKTWRVHSIFTNIKMKKRVIQDKRLFAIVGVLLLIDVLLLVTWEIKDPMKRMAIEGREEPDPEGRDVFFVPVMQHCESVHMSIWLAVIYAYKGVLMIFGCFLAWETRHVSIPALNDSKYIGMCVYNVVVMCVIGVALSFLITNNPNATFGIISLFILFCTTVTLCLVFLPKLIELKRDPSGEEKKIRCLSSRGSFKMTSTFDGTSVPFKTRCLRTENMKLRKLLSEKDKDIEVLLEKLGMEPSYRYETSRTTVFPMETTVSSIYVEEWKPPSIAFAGDESTNHSANKNSWQSALYTCVKPNSSDNKEYSELFSRRSRDATLPTISSSDNSSEIVDKGSLHEYEETFSMTVPEMTQCDRDSCRTYSEAMSDQPQYCKDIEDVNCRLLCNEDEDEDYDLDYHSHSKNLFDSLRETAILSDSEKNSTNDIPELFISEDIPYELYPPTIPITVSDDASSGLITLRRTDSPFVRTLNDNKESTMAEEFHTKLNSLSKPPPIDDPK